MPFCNFTLLWTKLQDGYGRGESGGREDAGGGVEREVLTAQSPYLYTFMEPRNRFRGIEFASLCSLAGQYDKYGFVPARLAENRYLVSIKDLQIRALFLLLIGSLT